MSFNLQERSRTHGTAEKSKSSDGGMNFIPISFPRLVLGTVFVGAACALLVSSKMVNLYDVPVSVSTFSTSIGGDDGSNYALPVCSKEQLKIVQRLFPPGQTSRNTRCPYPTWWDDHMLQVFKQQKSSSSSPSRVRIGLSLGCNKGDDAVEMLAKLSGKREVSVDAFRNAFQEVADDKSIANVTGRACQTYPPTALAKNHPLWPKTKSHFKQSHKSLSSPPAQVFCVEAATMTAALLKGAQEMMPPSWKEDFTVTHAALGSHDGTAFFPRVDAGNERGGLCRPSANGAPPKNCESVPMYTVDTYMSKVVEPKVLAAAPSEPSSPVIVDILSVDVEGFDWDVLGFGGADTTLPLVKYLEFEYHKVGTWPKYRLSDVTMQLWEKYSMICYYAGVGKLWRLTHCFQEYFNTHGWSNVACVNPKLDPILAERMEAMFQSQLLNVSPLDDETTESERNVDNP